MLLLAQLLSGLAASFRLGAHSRPSHPQSNSMHSRLCCPASSCCLVPPLTPSLSCCLAFSHRPGPLTIRCCPWCGHLPNSCSCKVIHIHSGFFETVLTLSLFFSALAFVDQTFT